MAKVELKQPVVNEISEKIKDAQAVVLVDHRGLTVAQDTELRKKLREEGVTGMLHLRDADQLRHLQRRRTQPDR